ncbi:hypothetical protein ACJJTC_019196 [Scirpophaga incertulas]
MSIYEIPGVVKHAWPLAATPNNILNAFKKAGISPYNPEIFTDEDFAPSFVTDRPMPDTISLESQNKESHFQEIADLEKSQVDHNMEAILELTKCEQNRKIAIFLNAAGEEAVEVCNTFQSKIDTLEGLI